MIKAKSKNINITIILLLLSLLCGISDVRADTIYNASYDEKASKSASSSDIINNKIGNGYKFTMDDGNGNKFNAYCVDPGGANPASGKTYQYTEVTNVNSTLKSQASVICSSARSEAEASALLRYQNVNSKIEGNNVLTSDTSGANAYLDAGFSNKDSEKIYKDATNSSNYIPSINVTYNEENTIATVIITNPTSGGSFKLFGNIQCTKNTNGDKLVCRANSCKGTDFVEGKVTYQSSSSGDGSESGDGSSGSSSSGNNISCTAKYYKYADPTSGGTPQYLISCFCNDAGGSKPWANKASDKDNLPDSKGDLSTPILLSCSEDPGDDNFPCFNLEFNYQDFNSDGSEICTENGNTVIQVSEKEEKSKETFDMDECLEKEVQNFDMGGISILANEAFNGYDSKYSNFCSIRCIEDFSMNLPGPDGKKGSESVVVNAGTFFTIDDKDGKISSNSTLKCYEALHPDEYNKYIQQQRNKVADAYNDMQIYKVAKDADRWKNEVCNVETSSKQGPCISYKTVTDPETGETSDECASHLYSWTAWIPDDQEEYSVGRNCVELTTDKYNEKYRTKDCVVIEWEATPAESGENTDGEVPEATKRKLEASCNEKRNKKITEITSNDAISNFETAQSTASNNITNADNYWKTFCDGWDITKLKNYNELPVCPGNITFSWFDNDWDDVKLDGTISKPYSKTTKETSDKAQFQAMIGLCNKKSCTDSDANNRRSDKYKNALYAHQILEIKSTYTFDNYFKVDNSNSVIKVPKPSDTSTSDGYIIHGFPVQSTTPRGTYEYWYDYGSIGYGYNSNGATCSGRLNGVINSLYGGMWEPFNTCTYTVNNCPGCDVGCGRDDSYEECVLKQKTCNSLCKVACVGGGCILDANAGFLATYRTISLNNFLAGRTNSIITAPDVTTLLAYNDTSLNSLLAIEAAPPVNSLVSSTNKFSIYKSNWDTPKGVKVASKITGDGEKIYDYDKDPEYSFILNPGIIAKIKEYNEKTAKKNGKYNSLENLSCNFKDNYYQCTSPFIDKEYGLKVKNFKHESYSGYEIEEFTGPAKK